MAKQLASFKSFGTTTIHGGQVHDPHTGALVVPISMSSTFAQSAPGKPHHPEFEYARSNNPTRAAFENAVAALEAGKHAFAFGSGSAATATLAHLLKSGDHVVCMNAVYGGTHRYFSQVAAPIMGMKVDFVDFTKYDELEAAIKEGETKLVWLETPTNPTLVITDIERVAKMAHAKGALLVVDNTFMSSRFQRPLTLGADIVLHSVTKYLNGHSDVVMGVVACNDDKIAERIIFLQNAVGAIPSPFDCSQALRGIKTLNLRMERHAQNAMAVAKFLEASDLVEKAVYPGLESHPQHELANKQMTGYGGMVTFFIKGGLKENGAFLSALKTFTLAESLGAVESLAEAPAVMTHAAIPKAEREAANIFDNLVRLSVGVEDIEDLLADLEQALVASQL